MSNQSMADDPELVQEFLTETTELLEQLDNDLVDLESDPKNQDLLNRIFRAFHTIKGTSSFLAYDQLVELNHSAEDLLQLFRSGEKTVTPDSMDVILKAIDVIKELVDQVRNNRIEKLDLTEILEKLNNIKTGKEETPAKPEAAPEEEIPAGEQEDEPEEAAPDVKKNADKAESSPVKERQVRDEGSSTMRVDVTRLDDLMNLVGELVLERNRLVQLNREYRINHNSEEFVERVQETTDKIHFVTTELQMSVMKTRMLPIDRLFKKFARMIRDIARERDKKVDLIITGGETELEKTVIDQLGDPLVHLMRNAIDHGIEPSDEREKLGKSRIGKLELSAVHEGNHILVHIRDDGRGLDTDKIKRKAAEKGLFSETQLESMSKQEVMQIIFEPGFSTADKVSDLSGRGVGMDVVKTNIRNLNGIIDLYSEKGRGTEIVLKLPLTLAVMQALMVKVENDIYAVPLSSVLETFRIREEDIDKINQKEVVRYRDSVIPLLYLSRLFRFGNHKRKTRAKEGTKKQIFHYVVLIGVAEKRFGLIVDKLIGQEEVVIKSLGEYMGNIRGIAGGTISGDGRVRLIVDSTNLSDLVR